MQFSIVAVIGLALRVLYLRHISPDIFTRNLIIDAKFYDEWAMGLLRGAWNNKEVFKQDPLYAYFLAACYAMFGHGPNIVRYVQALLDVGTLGMLFVLGTRLFNARTGVIAALLAALYGPMMYYCGLLDKTSLSMFLVSSSLVSAVYVSRRPSMLGFIVSGLIYGIAILSRGNILFVAMGTALWLAFRKGANGATSRKVSLLHSTAFSAGFIAIIGVVSIRNYRVSGDFVPLTSNAGLNFFIGNNPNTVGTYIEPPFLHGIPDEEFEDSRLAAEHFSGRKFTKASEVSRFWLKQGLNFIAHRPRQWLELIWKKVFLALNQFEIPETYSFDYFKGKYGSLSAAFIGYGLIAPLGMLGAAQCLLRGNINLLHVFFFTYAASLCAFFVTSRYRLPLIIPLIIFSAMLISQGIERLKAKSWSGMWPFLIPFACMIGFCRWTPDWLKYHVIGPSLATPHTIAGYMHLQPTGNVQSAIDELEVARRINPGEPTIYAYLGTAYERLGRFDEAVAAFKEAVRRNRYFHEAYNNLAMLYYRQGNYPMALQAVRIAVELRPEEPIYQHNYQMMSTLPAHRPNPK